MKKYFGDGLPISTFGVMIKGLVDSIYESEGNLKKNVLSVSVVADGVNIRNRFEVRLKFEDIITPNFITANKIKNCKQVGSNVTIKSNSPDSDYESLRTLLVKLVPNTYKVSNILSYYYEDSDCTLTIKWRRQLDFTLQELSESYQVNLLVYDRTLLDDMDVLDSLESAGYSIAYDVENKAAYLIGSSYEIFKLDLELLWSKGFIKLFKVPHVISVKQSFDIFSECAQVDKEDIGYSFVGIGIDSVCNSLVKKHTQNINSKVDKSIVTCINVDSYFDVFISPELKSLIEIKGVIFRTDLMYAKKEDILAYIKKGDVSIRLLHPVPADVREKIVNQLSKVIK